MSGYTIAEIVVWLLLAAILGFILGWLLRTLKCQREHNATERTAATTAPAATATTAKAAALRGAGKVESAGFAKSAAPLAGGKAPSAEYTIKGNKDSMYYHAPDSRSYGQTIAEVWFKTEADARAAGFTKPGSAAKKATTKKTAAKKTAAKNPPRTPSAGGAPTAKNAAAKKATAAQKAPATKKAPAAKKAPAKKVAKKAVAAGRFAGSAKPLSGGRAPSAEYKIKGNEDSMIYHTPESPSYGQTIAETWFKTEAAAVAAGFRKPLNA